MNFVLSEEQVMFRDMARKICRAGDATYAQGL